MQMRISGVRFQSNNNELDGRRYSTSAVEVLSTATRAASLFSKQEQPRKKQQPRFSNVAASEL